MIAEEKGYWNNGKIRWHYFRKDFNLHGEFKSWWSDGRLIEHCFYKDDKNITNEVTLLVVDILNITAEKRMMLKLRFGIKCV